MQSFLLSSKRAQFPEYMDLRTRTISATVFEIFTVKDRKLLILPSPALFDAP